MVDKIVLWPNKILTTPCEYVEKFDDNIRNLARTLESTLYGVDGYGLAANQIGHPWQIIAVRLGNDLEFLDRTVKVFINPMIVAVDGPTIQTTEGCLSLPGVRANIKSRRPDITVAAFGVDGAPFQERYINMDAVIIAHEVDHICGRTLLDHMKGVFKESALKKLKKLEVARAR